MRAVARVLFPPLPAMVALLSPLLAVPPSAPAQTTPPSAQTATRSGNDLILSFPTTSRDLYNVQTCPDLLQPWTNFGSPIIGDGSTKTVILTNALSTGRGFSRIKIQQPTSLVLPESMAFGVLGHACGGFEERAYVTGFDPSTGYPKGAVWVSTTCSSGGRGSHGVTYTAWAAVSWDLTGNAVSATTLSNALSMDPAFIATDVYGDVIYNAGAAAYLVVPAPAAPTSVTAVQSGDQFEVSWMPVGVSPEAVASTTVMASPVNSTAPVLTNTVAGAATNGFISLLQPATTYQITVLTTTISGSSPASAPIRVTTVPASVPPSAPPGFTVAWSVLDPAGATDVLVAKWEAADPGNSPVDQYTVTITGSDGAGSSTQTVSGTTLSALFSVDCTPNWSVTVQAHNAFGWGPSTSVVTLGGL